MKKYFCWECGDIATSTRHIVNDGFTIKYSSMSSMFRCYCDKCKKHLDQAEKEERNLYIKLKKREMFRKACELLEKQNTNMYEYKDAIDVVKEKVESCPDKFDSSYEVLTAIILVQNRIYSKMQYKVGRYQVDFLLEELGIVLEIDGERHNHRKDYDNKRDKAIKEQLGLGWEIIRIKTDYLDMNAKMLPKAIDKVVQYRETNHINWREL